MAPKSNKKAVEEREPTPMSTSSAGESSSSEVESTQSGSDSDSDSSTSSNEKTSTQKTSRNVSLAAPQPYKAPSGFKSLKQQAAPKSNVSSLLSDLRGKQVYHITAPDYLPLSKVEEVSLAKIMQGKPVLKHKGVQYGIPVESFAQPDLGGKTLHLYDSKTKTYYSTAASNIPSYHIQEMLDIPEVSDETVAQAVQEQIKPPRKHPKHLKMRFHPVGSGVEPPETLGSSSEESEDEKPTFKVPKSLEKERDERKRKNHPTEADGSQAEAGDVPRKKSRKSAQEGGEGEDKKKKSSKSREEKKRKKSEKST
ncbi:hypothetical protein AtubIFM55763_000236 [Aspergillus tubingensis]|uniref:Uncharacterized protein n=2 Tax=Aspergillus subgen. Circumdati TaxID=2720871 RepID=A0ACD1IQN0_9EURO|nr:hypothetical protein BO79DRAFT_167548 [Aspergillus costaricaensis CBS 115574]XP_035358595.1 nuclear pore complex assembly family protein [Aspergillus tubingensis]GAQ39192.1 similar to An07g06630 [Aspergillus niger]RAK92416.1 hypothetical protein BO79DRAFT_167548 [Aspergillus costaricaensis CBS 115574]GFN17791.1 nuclear pore complex assembly family protein [Aspergillus tubingensis]GLA67978.1 hypothetical protein AtubIFM55763_000236 [Aspergillus tubingensis]GLB05352.1 hypothetical protein At